MDDKKRRSDYDIYARILRVLSKSRERKTPIANKANLNYNRLDDHLDPLLENGLIREQDKFYKITEKGEKFLGIYDDLIDLLNGGDKI